MVMNTVRSVNCFGDAELLLVRKLARFGLGFAMALVFSGTALAQYGGGNMGGGGMGSGSPSTYGSGNGKAIGIGIGAAAAGASAVYLARHHLNSINGCVSQAANDRLSLLDNRSGKTYSLLGGADVKPGEQVKLSGKKTTDPEGNSAFEVKKVEKDLGACR
jgi:hypothetical protein